MKVGGLKFAAGMKQKDTSLENSEQETAVHRQVNHSIFLNLLFRCVSFVLFLLSSCYKAQFTIRFTGPSLRLSA